MNTSYFINELKEFEIYFNINKIRNVKRISD